MSGGGSDIIRGVPILLDADMTVHDIVAALERLQFRNGFRLGGYVMPITKIRGLGTKHRHGVFLAEGEWGGGHEAFAIHPGCFRGCRLL
jgi:hypothetical protein